MKETIKAIWDRIEAPYWWLKHEIWTLRYKRAMVPRACYQVDDNGQQCQEDGEPCYLTDEYKPNEWYCADHLFEAGYCRWCNYFWAGNEDFDFGDGYCFNCRDEALEADFETAGEDPWIWEPEGYMEVESPVEYMKDYDERYTDG